MRTLRHLLFKFSRRWRGRIILATLALFSASPILALSNAQGFCEIGGQSITAKATNSGPMLTRGFQQSFARCTVNVYLTGTLTLATIYSTSTSTPLANPFTADVYGHWRFYAADGSYDVTISGGTPAALAAPYTFSAVQILSSSGGGGGSNAFSALTTSTNVSAVMTVGTGAQLVRTGSGIIDANKILGTTLSSLTGVGTWAAGVPGVVAGTGTDCIRVNGTSGACGSGSPGGANTEVQFNASAAFDGDSELTWNDSTKTLATRILTATQTVSVGSSPPVCTPGTGAGCFATPEGAVPSAGATAGVDVLYGDSTSHTLKASYNNGSYYSLTQTIASGAKALDTDAILTTACDTIATTAATGAVSTDTILITPNADISLVTGYTAVTTGGLSVNWWLTADVIHWKVCNPTSSTITPGAVTLNWRILR